jgi:hypothetical protein
MIERIIRAITFKTEVYPEVSKDETFTNSAWIIVGVVALISAIGGRAVMIRYNFIGYLLGVVVGAAVTVGAFALSVFVIKWLASALFKVELTFGELQRPLGLAYVFQVIAILGILGALSPALLCIVAPITLVAAIAGFISYLFALKMVTNLDSRSLPRWQVYRNSRYSMKAVRNGRFFIYLYPHGCFEVAPQGDFADFLHVLQALVSEIGVIQPGIMPALSQQSFVIPLFDYSPLLHHDDAVGALDRRKAVGDQDAGCALQDQVQCLLDLPLGEGIDAGRGFIQHKDRRSLDQHAHE